MEDRELLELAAKAAGIYRGTRELSNGTHYISVESCGLLHSPLWNPLTDDGDALRLAVKLEFLIRIGNGVVIVDQIGQRDYWEEHYTDDPYTAMRRAIVRAAAEIGSKLEN